MTVEILRLPELRSEADRQAVLATLRSLTGLGQVEVNLASRTLRLARRPELGLDAVLRTLQAAGYRATPLA